MVSTDDYIGTAGQDILMAGMVLQTLIGGNGKDIMIGDEHGSETI